MSLIAFCAISAQFAKSEDIRLIRNARWYPDGLQSSIETAAANTKP